MLKKTLILLLASISLSSYAQDKIDVSKDKADLNIYTPINVVPKVKQYNYNVVYANNNINISTIMNMPITSQNTQKELQAVCLVEHKVDGKVVETITKNSRMTDGFYIELTPIEEVDGHVKTLMNLTIDKILGEARIHKFDDRCTVVVGYTKTDTGSQIIDLERNKAQQIQLPSGEIVSITLTP